jgi:tRNA threonylcarbamoyladenosine biosynthesis protein TsaB
MRVLAVDTTSSLGSVALVDGSVVRGEEHLTGSDTHSVHLLPAIERLLLACEVDRRALDAFAVAVGPGSFTGLRVGLSTVQGLALAACRPCLGASVLDVLGFVSPGATTTMALRDAFRGEVYWAAYDGEGRPTGPPRVGPLADVLAQATPDTAFVGDAAASHHAAIANRFPRAGFPPFPTFLAATLGLWAEPRLRAGLGYGPESLRPLYVRTAEFRKASA